MITWKEIPKAGRVVIIVIIILLLIWFSANIYRILKRPPNAHYISGGGSIPKGWDKAAVTNDLFSGFKGIDFTGGENAMHDFNQLNDNQMISVYNDWNDRYSQQSIFLGMGSYGTLTNTLNKESFPIGSNALREAQIMTANLKRLQLP